MKWTRSSLPGLMLLFVFSETISANDMFVKSNDEDISMKCDPGKITIERICIGSLSLTQECQLSGACNEVQSYISDKISSCGYIMECFFPMFQLFPPPTNPESARCLLITYNCDNDSDEDGISTTSSTEKETDDDDEEDNGEVSRTSDYKGNEDMLSTTSSTEKETDDDGHDEDDGEVSRTSHSKSNEDRLSTTSSTGKETESQSADAQRNNLTIILSVAAILVVIMVVTIISIIVCFRRRRTRQYAKQSGIEHGTKDEPVRLTSPIYMDSSDMNSSRYVTEASGSSDNLHAKVQRNNNKEVGETELHENPAYLSYEQNESRGSPAN